MKKLDLILQIVVLGFSVISFSSCFSVPIDPYIVDIDRQRANSYHAPATLHAPLISNKNDVNLGVHYAFLTRHKGLDLQTSYMPVKHLGLQASYRFHDQKGKVEDGKIESFEFGAGYVKDWGSFLFETYAGIGGGSIQNFHHSGQSNIKFTNYFIQPAFAIQTRDRITQFAVVAKLSPTKFNVRNSTFDTNREPFVASQIDIISNQPDRLFLEPGFVFRTGSKHVQVQTALSMPSNLRGKDFLRDKTNFSIGVVFRLNSGDAENGKN